ncbi:glutamine synthetase [Micrococcus sp. HSID17228]|uniref:glutamine synthetase family protein n=1 Tax=Micrococcus TaxID=1269 RepID=UPI000FBD564D|nr:MULTISPECIES: glutamine synthetase family protein [Micrococcus]RUQ43292.1 glutamine synthetase [Micrococcus sp. HSID17227]RUQ45735.1 glutamine synthetase [Micrococcus sp. HSID17228]
MTTSPKHPRNDRMLTVDQLRQKITDGQIDTVVLAFTDMQGRLQGKLNHAQFFLDAMLTEGAEGCNYLLAVDTEMNTPAGYAISSWEAGYGDMSFAMDLDTIRLMPHNPGQAMIQCDLTGHDGQLIPMSPRAMLRRQLDRARDMGYQMLTGTELEFCVYNTSYEDAWDANYQNLEPANKYNVDYNLLGSQRVEPLLREIRNAMYAAGMTVENAKGECNLGQHEIAFRFNDGLITADNHVVYKLSSKQIAHQQGKSITFMAKPNQREGSSCHIHMSLRGLDGELVFWDRERGTRSATYDHFIAGVLKGMREMSIFYAPNINSYKRFVKGSFAPTAVAWGIDNRSCAVRLVGSGQSARMENRLPGGDVNPYLALSAMLACGLYGIEHQLELEPMMEGNAYESDAPVVPSTMREARDLLAGSELAREVFGEKVVEHYVHYADVELDAFEAAVTDWELRRGFERL